MTSKLRHSHPLSAAVREPGSYRKRLFLSLLGGGSLCDPPPPNLVGPMVSSKRLSALAILLTLVVLLAGPVHADDGDSQYPVPEKTEQPYPNLGSSLNQLIASVEAGRAAEKAAESAPVHRAGAVAVTIYLSGETGELVAFLEENGAPPRNVGDGYVEAYVPVALLGAVSELPGVVRVREIVPAQQVRLAQYVRGQGPLVHGSTVWNQAGYGGQGIKVGVIDGPFGFKSFGSLMGNDLPSTVVARCYTDIGVFTQDLRDCESSRLGVGDDHGTLVAEAVVDIAPDAALYIASPWSKGDDAATADWMVSQGVSVIVYPISWPFDGPGDGTSPFGDSPLKAVDRAVSEGAVWLSAAGNAAKETWFGPYSAVDVGEFTFLVFDGVDALNDVVFSAGDLIRVQLRWDDSWGAARRDFDLILWDFATMDIVAASFDLQTGRAGQVPNEELIYLVPQDGLYAVVVAHDGGGIPDWLQVTVRGSRIEHHTLYGSIVNPAESANPGMLAVGAAHWDDVGAVLPFSSRGPTPDGRVKPDIVGATCGRTALVPLGPYGTGFCGTSQAAPHLAGMAALVRQRFPHLTPAQVAAYLKGHAEQREELDPNNTWGHGFAVLPLADVISASPAITSIGVATNLAPVRIDQPIPVTLTFSKPVTGFTASDLSAENAAVSNFAGSDGDSAYTFDITPAAIGEVAVEIPAGAATDGDGNENEAFLLSLGIPYDDDGDGQIGLSEVYNVIDDYFSHRIDLVHVWAAVDSYFSGVERSQ